MSRPGELSDSRSSREEHPAKFLFGSLLALASPRLFETAPAYTVGPNPVSVAVGDFNHDGFLDLAVANAAQGTHELGSVSILLGIGNGSFLPPVNYYFPNNVVSSVAVGDFNGDGNLDVAAAYDKGLAVLLGNGDGTFRPATTYGTYATEAGSRSVPFAAEPCKRLNLPIGVVRLKALENAVS